MDEGCTGSRVDATKGSTMTEIQVQGDTFFVAARGFGPGLLPMALSVAMRGQVALAWRHLYEHNAIVLFNRVVDADAHELLYPHGSEQLAIMLLHRLERMGHRLSKPQTDGDVKAGWIVKAGDSLPDAIRYDRNILCIVAPTWEVFGK